MIFMIYWFVDFIIAISPISRISVPFGNRTLIIRIVMIFMIYWFAGFIIVFSHLSQISVPLGIGH